MGNFRTSWETDLKNNNNKKFILQKPSQQVVSALSMAVPNRGKTNLWRNVAKRILKSANGLTYFFL